MVAWCKNKSVQRHRDAPDWIHRGGETRELVMGFLQEEREISRVTKNVSKAWGLRNREMVVMVHEEVGERQAEWLVEEGPTRSCVLMQGG